MRISRLQSIFRAYPSNLPSLPICSKLSSHI
jgi:hypothetical protein